MAIRQQQQTVKKNLVTCTNWKKDEKGSKPQGARNLLKNSSWVLWFLHHKWMGLKIWASFFCPQNESSFKLTHFEKKWSSKFEANTLQKPTTRLVHAPWRNEQKICPSTLNSPLQICKNPNLKCALMNPKQKAWQDAHTWTGGNREFCHRWNAKLSKRISKD